MVLPRSWARWTKVYSCRKWADGLCRVYHTVMVPLEKLEALLPSSLLEQLAMSHQVDKHNQVRLSGKLVFLCLLHTLLYHQELTQRLLEEAYAQYTNQHA